MSMEDQIRAGIAGFRRRVSRNKPASSRSRWRKRLDRTVRRAYRGARVLEALRRSLFMKIDDRGCEPDTRARLQQDSMISMAIMGTAGILPGLVTALERAGEGENDGSPAGTPGPEVNP